MAFFTQQQYIDLLVNEIKKYNPNLDVSVGSTTRDVFVYPSAAALSYNAALLELTSISQSVSLIVEAMDNTDLIARLAEALNISPVDVITLLQQSIDRIGNSLNLTRKAATYANGFAYFYVSGVPSNDLTVPVNTEIQTSYGVIYKVTQTTVLMVANINQYYNPVLQKYAVLVPIQAVNSGSNYNVAERALIFFGQNPPNGFEGVINLVAINNGKDIESYTDFADRIKTTYAGVNIATKNGLKALITNNIYVNDIIVITSNDPEMIRNEGKGGVVDIYVKENSPTLEAETFTYNTTEPYILSKQPVLDIIQISGIRGGVQYSFIENTDFVLQFDTNAISKNSTIAKDKIVFINPPDPNTEFTVTYVTNYIMQQIKDLLYQDDYLPLMGNVKDSVAVKMGEEVKIDINAKVNVLSSYSKTTVVNDIIGRVNGYINDLKFGEGITQSDIINIIENTPGVQSVEIPLLKFNVSGQSEVVDRIDITQFEYLVLGEILIQ